MKIEIAIAIAIGWFILRAVNNAIKNNKAKLQRGGQNSNNSGNAAQEILSLEEIERRVAAQELASQEAVAQDQATRSKEGQSLEREVEEKSTRIIDPFLEPTSLETNRGHYDEEALTEEYTTTHEQGKTVAHHKHQLFDPNKDRRKAVHLKGASGTSRRTERRVKKVHPIAKALASPGGRKQAIILSEILKRPEF